MAGITDQINSMLGFFGRGEEEEKESTEDVQQTDTKGQEEHEEQDKEVQEEGKESKQEESEEEDTNAELSKDEQIAALTRKIEELSQKGAVIPTEESSEFSLSDDIFKDIDFDKLTEKPEGLKTILSNAFASTSKEIIAHLTGQASKIAQQEAMKISDIRDYQRNFFSKVYPELSSIKTTVITAASELAKTKKDDAKLDDIMKEAAEKIIKDFGIQKITDKTTPPRTPRGQKKSISEKEELTGADAQIQSMLDVVRA